MDNPDLSYQDTGPKKTPFDELGRDELINKCKGLLAIAQKAKLAKSELQNELEVCKTQLDKCEKEKKRCSDNINTLQELVDSLTEQKLNFITDVDSAQGMIKTLTVKCASYEENINGYKTEIIVKDNKIADINQKLSDLDNEVTSLRRQNNRLLEENEQLLTQLTEFEARTVEFNNIGMQQREQLKILEESVHTEEHYKKQIEDLNIQIKQLENKLSSNIDFENKLQEATELYETEKAKKEKANVKLRSYKDKILKCAACINQLKNSRFILTKTVKEYSENIPKWQNDIIKASKVLDNQINELNRENSSLKERLLELEKQLNEIKQTDNCITDSELNALTQDNLQLKDKVSTFEQQLTNTISENSKLKADLDEKIHQLNENKLLKENLHECSQKLNDITHKYNELDKSMQDLNKENQMLNDKLHHNMQFNDELDNLTLQIKALESEKSMLVKEKLNARDNVVELDNQNKVLTENLAKSKSELQILKSQMDLLLQEKSAFEINFKKEKENEMNMLKCNLMAQQEQFNLLKKEHEDLQDLNGLLKEEVETLKLSLEQPKDDNLSDLNVSLQADIVKLETKLAAYKQENASLLSEIKDARNKSKEFDSLIVEYEDAKSKLASYKSENTELLNEMKEINQVLKERGESISKLQKAVSEMETLVETLEKDRENMSQEKVELMKKNEVLKSNLKDSEQKTYEKTEAANLLNVEIDNAMKNLSKKDDIIASLKEEIEKLKQQQIASAELPNEDMSTSTISKAEELSRMKDLDETFEEKYTKLRIFALKLKKKLNESTTQLQQTEKDKSRLEKLLSESKPIHTDEIDGSRTEKACENGIKNNELEEKVKSLNATLETTKNVTIELDKVKAELAYKTQQLVTEMEAHKVTKENLEKARRDVKKKNVLSLEMEDYERSMKELTTKMEESKKKMMQMESTIDTQEGTITAMKTQIKLLEEQIKTEERQNRLVKEELQHAIEEGKEKNNLIQMKNNVISKLEQDLEDEKRKNEESDLEMTSLLSDKEKVIMALGEDKAELNNKVKKLEFKCSELNEKLRITNIELADLKTEYTSYKVRAQAVLRQNQTVDHSQEEQLKEDAAALRAQIETLTAKLATAQEQISEKTSEVESARRRVAEATNEAARAQQRTTRLHADLARLSQQIESERTQNKLQVTTLTQCYKTQLSEMEAKLQKETEQLKKQLAAAAQETRKSGNVTVASLDDPNRNQYMLPVIPKDEGSDGEMDINVSLIPREEGEGSESAPSPPPSKSYLSGGGSGRSPVPLERLLEEGVPDDEAMDTTSLGLTPDQEIADLKRRLQAQQQRVKHVTVLLSESERECARMAQLSELLKAELRRVRGATQNAHNTEYMKNVTLKFLTLPPGDERSRLVPVLQQILTLTNEETQKINAVAKGLDPNPGKGWGSYLPWPGGK